MPDSRSPDAIQREIEATRAELAETIDAIADRVSPRKAASRSAHAMKAKASAALGHAEKTVGEATGRAGDLASRAASPSPNGSANAEPPVTARTVPAADSGQVEPEFPTVLNRDGTTVVNGRPATVLDATPDQAAQTNISQVAHLEQRKLRTDRVLVGVGVLAAAAGAVVLIRSRGR